MRIYTVIFNWSTDDSDGVDVEVFDTFDKSYNRFKEIIKNELNAEMSWVGAEAFDDNGNVSDRFQFDEFIDDSGNHELWWHIVDYDDYNRHSFIELRFLELQ